MTTTPPPTAASDISRSQLSPLQSNPTLPPIEILGRTCSAMLPSISWDRKTLVLGILVVQTSMLHLTLRISRSAGAKPYNAIAAVTYTELIKFFVSLIVFSAQSGGFVKALRIVFRETTTKFRSVSLLLIPAMLYSIQNTLVIYAISYLSAAQFSVARQVKIPITGLFSVLLLRKELGVRKWLAIFAVASGVAVVQLAKTHQDSYRLFTDKETESSATKGLMFAMASCFTSGLASVWFEMLLKNKDKVSLWLMNIQLAGFSAIISTTAVLLTADMNAFTEFDGLALLSVSFSASDGLVIALVVKYADNILKGFATSLAICITASASVLMGDMPFSKELMLGCLIVVSAIGLYGGGNPSVAVSVKPHGTV